MSTGLRRYGAAHGRKPTYAASRSPSSVRVPVRSSSYRPLWTIPLRSLCSGAVPPGHRPGPTNGTAGCAAPRTRDIERAGLRGVNEGAKLPRVNGEDWPIGAALESLMPYAPLASSATWTQLLAPDALRLLFRHTNPGSTYRDREVRRVETCSPCWATPGRRRWQLGMSEERLADLGP